jgi:uncharacterized membrane protein YidH (DUF202 family)
MGMTRTSEDKSVHAGWLAHDLVVGALGGAVVGFVLTWFRYAVGLNVDHWLIQPMAAIAGAILGIGTLRWERRRRGGRRRPGPATVAVWALALLAVAFIALVVHALSQFE